MRTSKLLILFIIVLLLLAPVSSKVIVNSDNWQDTAVSLNYAQNIGEEVFFVKTPGDASVASKSLNQDSKHLILSSEDKPAVKDLDSKLENSGISVETQQTNWEKSQNRLYREIKEEQGALGKFIVVKPDFGTGMVTAFPKVVQDDYHILFYTDNTAEFLEKEASKVIFLGEYVSRPWKNSPYKYELVDKGNPGENNREFIRRFLSQKNWVTLIGKNGVDKDALLQGSPLVLKEDVDDTAEFLESQDVKTLEVIGAQNALYGKQVEELVEQELRTVVKIGRTFTGEEELEGERYPLKLIEPDWRRKNLSIGKTVYDKDSGLFRAEILNNGNTDSHVEIREIQLKMVNGTVIALKPEKNVKTDASSTFPYITDLDSGLNISQTKVTAISDNERVLGKKGLGFQDIKYGNVGPVEDINTEEVVFNTSSNRFSLSLTNRGDGEVWVKALSSDSSEILESESKVLASGETASLKFKNYISSENVSQNSRLNFTLFQGEDENKFVYSQDLGQSIDVRPRPIELKAKNILTVASIVMLAVFIAVVTYFERDWLREKVFLPETLESFLNSFSLEEADENYCKY